MPVTWLDELKAAYPKRSGPMSWPRVFLKVRRALLETSWDDCIAGVKRYAKYCQEAGIEGSGFVVAPARFFEDEIYLEDLTFTPVLSKEDSAKSELRERDRVRMLKAIEAGARFVPALIPDHGECAAAFETRVMLANRRVRRPNEQNGMDREPSSASSELHSDIGELKRSGESVLGLISNLADRMRVSK